MEGEHHICSDAHGEGDFFSCAAQSSDAAGGEARLASLQGDWPLQCQERFLLPTWRPSADPLFLLQCVQV